MLIGEPKRRLKTPHLLSALVAVLILAASLAAGESYAARVENDFVYALVPLSGLHLRSNGVFQQAAVRQPDLLMMYGSSELTTGGPSNASAFFRTFPTGFGVFGVYGPAADALVILQETATLGSGMKGKKIAISLSPQFFLSSSTPEEIYQANFSLRNANELAFSGDLSLSLKGAAAKRMLDYPRSLKQDHLLNIALTNLAAGSLNGRAVYFALFPLGKLHLWVLRLAQHWQALDAIRENRRLSPGVVRRPSSPDWAKLAAEPLLQVEQDNGDDPFGLSDPLWQQNKEQWVSEKSDLSDQVFLRLLRRSKEWEDLSLLLAELRELGAQPLIMTSPWDGFFFDYRGVSAAARARYYDGLRQVAKAYGVPLVSFEDHEYDKSFFLDVGHPSSKGWIYYDQALDAFYHGAIH